MGENCTLGILTRIQGDLEKITEKPNGSANKSDQELNAAPLFYQFRQQLSHSWGKYDVGVTYVDKYRQGRCYVVHNFICINKMKKYFSYFFLFSVLIDLHVLGCFEHVLRIFGKCLLVRLYLYHGSIFYILYRFG